MKVRSFLYAILIAISVFFFGNLNTVRAGTADFMTNTIQNNGETRVEYVVKDGVLWIIVYDADENIVQASAVGHAG
jgi:hypothetical protein